MIKFGVIGYGYWGPNVVRNLDHLDGSQLVAVCDKSPTARKRFQKAYPHVKVTADSAELVTSTEIDAIAVVTPVWTHYELTKAALQNGKHVFVEKPFTSNAAQAEELINLAAQKHLKIMVDHTFLFTGAVQKIGQLLEEGSLGKIYYYDSTRVNLGLFQHDVNVIWDLAPHDLSIIDHLIKDRPEAVVATGQTHLNGLEDVAFITVYFPNKMIYDHVQVRLLQAALFVQAGQFQAAGTPLPRLAVGPPAGGARVALTRGGGVFVAGTGRHRGRRGVRCPPRAGGTLLPRRTVAVRPTRLTRAHQGDRGIGTLAGRLLSTGAGRRLLPRRPAPLALAGLPTRRGALCACHRGHPFLRRTTAACQAANDT